jgi:hypothetical protein
MPSPDLHQQIATALEAALLAPPQSRDRAKAMHRLIYLLQQHPKLKRVKHQDYSLALNQTWIWLSRHLQEFQPTSNPSAPTAASITTDLIRWINGYLHWRIHDLYHPTDPDDNHLSLDNLANEDGQTYLDLLSDEGWITPSFSNLGEHLTRLRSQQNQTLASQIEQWIETDPDRTLQTCYPRNQPHCNCQALATQILLKDPPDSFTDLATALGIPYQTLVAHWKRRCLPLLQQQTKKLGHEP